MARVRSVPASTLGGSVRRSENPPIGSVHVTPSGMRRRSAARSASRRRPYSTARRVTWRARNRRSQKRWTAAWGRGRGGGAGGALPARPGRGEPAETEAGEEDLRERADVEDQAVAIERAQRGGRPRSVVEGPVEPILDDPHPVPPPPPPGQPR